MTTKYLLASAFAVAMCLTGAAALADVKDYAFESVAAEFKKGDDVVVAVRLLHKPTGKPVARTPSSYEPASIWRPTVWRTWCRRSPQCRPAAGRLRLQN